MSKLQIRCWIVALRMLALVFCSNCSTWAGYDAIRIDAGEIIRDLESEAEKQ